MSRVTSVRKMECKMCKDAGKSRQVCESHFAGKCCPTLQECSCARCGKNGHTKKYCKVNLDSKKADESERKPAKVSVAKAEPEKSSGGGFALLGDLVDSDSESELSPNVTLREKAKPKARFMNWADDSDDDDAW